MQYNTHGGKNMTLDKLKQFLFDDETEKMLAELAEGSDGSKVIRDLIRTAWKLKHGIIEVPIVGKLNKKTIIATGKSDPMLERGE